MAAHRNITTNRGSIISTGVVALQGNAGKGRAATEVLLKTANKHKASIILCQEPGPNLSHSSSYIMLGASKSKAPILVQKELKYIMMAQYTTLNCTVVKLGDPNNETIIVNLYIEPLRDWAPEMGILLTILRNHNCQVVIAGDVNAKYPAWGGTTTNQRGEELYDLLNSENAQICNDPHSDPTFETVNGTSWVDITASRGVRIPIEWRILEDESLSDHKYIKWQLYEQYAEQPTSPKYIHNKANWTKFRYQCTGSLSDDKLEIRTTAEDADRLAVWAQDTVTRIARNCMPYKSVKVGNDAGHNWWDSELLSKKREVHKARKRYQLAAVQFKPALRNTYDTLRREYKHLIKAKKANGFKAFVARNTTENPWGAIYKIINAKRHRSATQQSTIWDPVNNIWTTSSETTTSALIQTYFPADPCPRKEETNLNMLSGPDDQFTWEEIKEILREAKSNKAPGPDKLTWPIIRTAIETCPRWWTKFYNTFLNMGYFPKPWKTAKIIWLPKPGNNGVRPISLLPIMGKILDKLLAKRTQFHLEKWGFLSQNQYGFREGKSTVQAIQSLINLIDSNKAQKLHSAVIALDLKNAFNAAWHPAIKTSLQQFATPRNVYHALSSFLTDRSIIVDRTQVEITRGCPQGSCLGPVLWLVLMESWLRMLEELRSEKCKVSFIAFADDQIIVLSGPSAKEIEITWQRVWAKCMDWAITYKAEYNMAKTEYLFCGASNISRPPELKINGNRIKAQATIKYLGLRLDPKLLFLEHIKEVRTKIAKIATRLNWIATVEKGMSATYIRTLYIQAVRPAILYAAEIWGRKAHDTRLQRQLNATQRPFLIRQTRAYRTTPTLSIEAITGIPPLHMEAARIHDLYESSQGITNVLPGKRPHPSQRGLLQIERLADSADVNELRFYADGSESEHRVGAAVVCVRDKAIFAEHVYSLQQQNSGYQAELAAINEATKLAEQHLNGIETVNIISDSIAALQAVCSFRHVEPLALETYKRLLGLRWSATIKLSWIKGHSQNAFHNKAHSLAKINNLHSQPIQIEKARSAVKKTATRKLRESWQQAWSRAEVGRITHSIMPALTFLDMGWCKETVWWCTGHGPFNHYYNRFRLRPPNVRCPCGVESTPRHILLECNHGSRRSARLVAEDGLRRIGQDGLHSLHINISNQKAVSAILNKVSPKMIIEEEL